MFQKCECFEIESKSIDSNYSDLFSNIQNNSNNANNSFAFLEKIEEEKNKKNLFKTTKENSTASSDQFINKKKGRHKNESSNSKTHDKYSLDNILAKIQVHYINFIISYINDILEQLKFDEEQRFLDIEYKFKRDIKKKSFEIKEQKSLADIICNPISSKYKKHSKNHNKLIFETIRKNNLLNELLNENYYKFFKLYYNNKKIIYLKDKKQIFLSEKVKTFNDLKYKLKSDKKKNYSKYLEIAINEKFLKNIPEEK